MTRLADHRLRRMHDVMLGYVERGEIPGMVNLIATGNDVHVEALGETALVSGQPVERDTIFPIASVTKTLTAVAAMILVEDCVLRLDDPVDDLLPELADRQVVRSIQGALEDTVPANRAITLRDLLTLGLGHGMVMLEWDSTPYQRAWTALGQGPPDPASATPPDEWMRRLGEIPLAHQPGERWLYNTGSDVLGVLIARASGQSLPDFMRERIFEQLAMKDTGFFVPTGSVDRLIAQYQPNASGGIDEVDPGGASSKWTTPPPFPSGAGGLVSTVDDLLAFAQMMLNGGATNGARIVSRPTVDAMTTNQLSTQQLGNSGLTDGYFTSHGWGLGMSVVTRLVNPWEPVGQYGWDGGLGTTWANDPAGELIGIQFTSVGWVSPARPPVHRDFWTLMYAAVDAQ